MLATCVLFFVVSGLQFWISDYLVKVIGMSHTKVYKLYLFISLSAPISGLLFGGLVLDYFGGYQSKNAPKLILLLSFLSALVSIPISFLDNENLICLLFWALFFFGGINLIKRGSLLPGVTGIMLSSVQLELRSSANSICHLFSNLLGYIPAPILYGLAQELHTSPDSRAGMTLLTFWTAFGTLFIYSGLKESSKQTETINPLIVELMKQSQNKDQE